ncbi:Panacea domain-containing protein [Acetobacterium wieringae]|uniref:Panacea domain-containing protein n=1 Tax=Acetobacterium wieringae TaxID=52694 RepID=UPI00315889C7
MADIFDMAKAFLSIEPMTNKKLQKLCYYAKAWYLAFTDENLFDGEFQAWVHGPVNYELYLAYKENGFNRIPMTGPEDLNAVPEEFIDFANNIFKAYGHLTGGELEIVTHQEAPWINARGDLEPWMSSNAIISEDDMKSFYRAKIKK